MVSVIHLGSSARRVLNYNEQKVSEGVALCLEAGFYLQEPDRLSFNQKLFRLQNQIALAPDLKYNTVHISLNFHPSENHDQATLKAIAATYLDKIGFAGQPYLLYQHFDAGHPHVHILTTAVKADGHGINLHNLGKVRSEKARKEIEIDFGLVRAEDAINKTMKDIKPINTKVHYGKAATKRAMLNVLNTVLRDYKFCSLTELNAVLNLYNVAAERGGKDSRVFTNGGLVYRVRNSDGTYQGVPIKASDFFIESKFKKGNASNSPTLNTLEAYFSSNKIARTPFISGLKSTIDLTLHNNEGIELKGFIEELSEQGIDTVLRYTKDEKVYGITFVDHKSGCVFNGRTIGKEYGAAAILRRCGEVEASLRINKTSSLSPVTTADNFPAHTPAPYNPQAPGTPESLLSILLRTEDDSSYLPFDLSGRKKIKKNNRRNRI